MNILLICTGNTCRSAMAEGILNKIISDNGANDKFTVVSAGISVFSPTKASDNAILALKDMGIDISSHISTQLTEEMINDADIILTMTASHKQIIKNVCDEITDKIYTLMGYAYGTDKDISDPYGMDLETYKKCAKEIYDALTTAYPKLLKQVK